MVEERKQFFHRPLLTSTLPLSSAKCLASHSAGLSAGRGSRSTCRTSRSSPPCSPHSTPLSAPSSPTSGTRRAPAPLTHPQPRAPCAARLSCARCWPELHTMLAAAAGRLQDAADRGRSQDAPSAARGAHAPRQRGLPPAAGRATRRRRRAVPPRPPPPPSPCTNWTRLVLRPVLSGHVSSFADERCRPARAPFLGRRSPAGSSPREGAGRTPRAAAGAGAPLTGRPPPPRTKWTRRVPHPVLIGHAASLTPYYVGRGRRQPPWWIMTPAGHLVFEAAKASRFTEPARPPAWPAHPLCDFRAADVGAGAGACLRGR
jgi:hypothetical protein